MQAPIMIYSAAQTIVSRDRRMYWTLNTIFKICSFFRQLNIKSAIRKNDLRPVPILFSVINNVGYVSSTLL